MSKRQGRQIGPVRLRFTADLTLGTITEFMSVDDYLLLQGGKFSLDVSGAVGDHRDRGQDARWSL